ncbi:MAG: hypothetical protein CHACPFDD_03403 [Phycisphaerae bacterium]|nr:hypothetical protein [Phycisphaerae bacterium]
MDEIARQRQFEEQFLQQIRAKAAGLTRGTLPADRVVVEKVPDGIDGVRATLSRLEVFDHELLHRMPGTQACQLKFTRSMLGGLMERTVSRLRAVVLAPVAALATGQAPGPVTREDVLNALARYDLMPRGMRPTGVVFAAPTGFSDSARSLVNGPGSPTVILMGGRADGGWDVSMSDAVAKSPWGKLFELETQDELVKRLAHHLDESADLVDSRGLSIEELSEKLGVDRDKTETLVRKLARTDPRIMTVAHDGRTHVCRTPFAEEGSSMSLWSRVRRLLRLKPTVAEQVREMTAQRVKLEQQRFEIDRAVNKLQDEEVRIVKSGAAATTDVEKRQLASKLVRLRRDLGRQKAQADVLTKQIDIIGTHLHHLTLAERGRRMELPKAEELTREAAQAEQVMADLSANAELAVGIEVGGGAQAVSDEEAAILEEFAAAAGTTPVKETPAAAPAAGESGRVADAGRSGPVRAPSAAPPVPGAAASKRESAKPEMG